MIAKNETEIMQNWRYAEPPLLSVAYIAYNQENYVAEALDSILMQETDFPFESVAHDDCSTDKTAEILAAYGQKYPNIIKLILQKENQFSKGIKIETILFPKTRGKYIAMCEGDDYWTDPHKLQIQVDAMRRNGHCQMSFHPALNRWENGSKKDEIDAKHADGDKIFTINEIILGDGGFCPTISLIFEREAVANLPEWFGRAPFGDYFLQILGAVKGGALYIDRTMAVSRRETPGSWSEGILKVQKREEQTKKMAATINEVDRYFDNRFHPEIQQKKSDWYYTLARAYFDNNDFKKFEQTIIESFHLAEKKSAKLLINYYLRKFHLFLQSLGKLNRYLVSKG